MAYTKIIVIRGRLDKCLRYAANEEKTYLEVRMPRRRTGVPFQSS